MSEVNLLTRVNDQEKRLIYHYMKYCGGRGGDSCYPMKDIDHWLRYWNINKQNLYNLLGGELIKTVKVTVSKGKDQMREDLGSQLRDYGSPGWRFVDSFNSFIYEYAYSRYIQAETEAADAVLGNRRHAYHHLQHLMSYDDLASNIYSGESIKLVARNGRDIIDINQGCKVSKALGKLAREYNLNGYEEFRVAHSMCLNQKMLKGELCFSIHPLDYMTMSDNDYGWTSCMSWLEGGDYRLGTIEMLNSPCVVIAYLKGSAEWEICPTSDGTDNKWSNKKWRELFIVDPNLILGIRPYPYENDDLEAMCLSYLKEWAGKNLHWGPYTEHLNKIQNIFTNTIGELDRKIHYNIYSDYMYCDVHGEHPAYVAVNSPDRVNLNYSGPAVCIECGDIITRNDDRVEPSILLCNECNPCRYCDECGELIDKDDLYEIDGYHLCEYCYDRATTQCDVCETLHLTDRIEKIYLGLAGERIGPYVCVCEDCLDAVVEAFDGKIREIHEGWCYFEICDYENLNPEAKDKVIEWFQLDEKDIERYEKVLSKA